MSRLKSASSYPLVLTCLFLVAWPWQARAQTGTTGMTVFEGARLITGDGGAPIPLPPALHLLSSWYVIACSAVLFLVEFFADKVPVFDLLWNALHTFVRIPVAALLAYAATAQLSSGMQLLATLLGGAIALAAHGGKTAVRAVVTPYPEPFSNLTLSLGEDALAVFHTWFATRHP